MDSELHRILKCVRSFKAEALKAHTKDVAKNDVIGQAVGELVLMHCAQLKPAPEMYKRCINGERISCNMILDSMSDDGVMIGAVAFQVAEQLELELPDNTTRSNKAHVVLFADEEEVSPCPEIEASISIAYVNYFRQHTPSMFLQNGYLFEHIRDNSSVHEDYKKMADCFLQMQICCRDDELFYFIHECLKSIYLNNCSGQEVQVLHLFKKRYETFLYEQQGKVSQNEYNDVMLTKASLSVALEKIEKIMKKIRS